MIAIVYQGQWHIYNFLIPPRVSQHGVHSCGGVACSVLVGLTLLRTCSANNASYFPRLY